MSPRAAMIFAAGLGTRMGALTATRPKPLIEVGGRPLIDQALDHAKGAGAAPIVVNVHYLADQIRTHLAREPVLIADETAGLLETGGGLKAALPLLGPDPVWTINSDTAWAGPNPLRALAQGWRPEMEALLLLVPTARARGYRGMGDFDLDPTGRLARGTSHVYTGAQILRTEGLAEMPDPVFSLNRLWDRAAGRGGLYGLVYSGAWCDVGRPENLPLAENLLRVGAP
ncbi:nucleotidyltransferase family protein [Rubellimicrobium roseum]|uniref:Nucleotidyltransferase family protein n=1 Tax=Rubellimicrobium roseum TaxID=687525 RepID=A0A5C4NPK4_9RHOB|nr:nucleotidyltransferase family protein [Rubellimicrobium roseum]TNC74319.1 nucleotidyltransferase family protein [Rubellimicrobium roseum]